jgi:hypothetical protein
MTSSRKIKEQMKSKKIVQLKSMIPLVTIFFVFSSLACNNSPIGQQTDLLIGVWEVTTVNGTAPTKPQLYIFFPDGKFELRNTTDPEDQSIVSSYTSNQKVLTIKETIVWRTSDGTGPIITQLPEQQFEFGIRGDQLTLKSIPDSRTIIFKRLLNA